MAPHQLPQLPYGLDQLAPSISEETMQYHYGKHHKGYVNNLNNLIEGSEFENLPLIEIIKRSEGAVLNNAAQHFNHTLFFLTLSSNAKLMPTEQRMIEVINRDFGSFDELKAKLTKAAISQFGSGWAWLSVDDNGVMSVNSTSNGDNPIRYGLTPLLCIDVWEHAYYIDYRNRRADFVDSIWSVLDWAVVEKRWLDVSVRC